jgi:4-alpha-glucanotransferase
MSHKKNNKIHCYTHQNLLMKFLQQNDSCLPDFAAFNMSQENLQSEAW